MRNEPDSIPSDNRLLLITSLNKLLDIVDWDPLQTNIEQCSIPPQLNPLSTDRELADFVYKSCEHLDLERKRLKERFELLSNNIAASIMIEDECGNMVYFSPFTEVLTGYKIEELPTSTTELLELLLIDEDRDRVLRGRSVSLIGEDVRIEYSIRHSTGMRFSWESQIVPIFDIDNTLQGLMWVSYDVSHYVQYRQAIQEKNDDLRDFTYMVSHDLKAPVHTIKGMASALAHDYKSNLDVEGQELLSFIFQAAKQMELLISSVVEYSNISTPRQLDEEIDVMEIMSDILRDLNGLIRETDATISAPGPFPIILGERLRLYQVFSNLIGNSLKYSHPHRKPQIVITSSSQRDWNRISVTDNGLGIPKDSHEKIFRPFHRAHSTLAEGSGIGLACVNKIVKQLGGTVTLTSEPDVGSTFTLQFPTPQRRKQELTRTYLSLLP